MPFDESTSHNIQNGADCGSYFWAQTYSDLEIAVRVKKPFRKDDIRLNMERGALQVLQLIDPPVNGDTNSSLNCLNDEKSDDTKQSLPVNWSIVLQGRFSHHVDVDSCFWILDNVRNRVVIFIDKVEHLWWSQLLKNERAEANGNLNHSISIGELNEGEQLICEKLMLEQMDKMKCLTNDKVDMSVNPMNKCNQDDDCV